MPEPGHQTGPGTIRQAVAALLNRWAERLHATPPPPRISEAQLRTLITVNSGTGHVREVMVPRTEVVFLDASLTVADSIQAVRRATHSRFPVIDGDPDDVLGFVHVRDLTLLPAVDPTVTLRHLTREVKRLPASKRVLAALSEMRRERHQLAVVVDEYGGTAGIVTLEDLIEELVGEIHDEYDAPPAPPRVDEGSHEVDGRLNLADLAERTGLTLPTGPYETVAGFLMARLGKLPKVGDNVRHDGWNLRVNTVEGRRVARISVARPVPPPRQPS
ncbi:hemolysin family protein [Dactylosporangium sp. NPDC051484]|uniref:hemolysin family protein n=1 Tax=Dactylosporangium sp. NPDC051484 TaxID=3154942 RepID=UPI00344C5E42